MSMSVSYLDTNLYVYKLYFLTSTSDAFLKLIYVKKHSVSALFYSEC